MKKSTLLKVALVSTAMFLFSGAFAQVADSDYAEYDANTTAPTNIDYVTLHTGGTTMGYYALPDAVYHPNYDAAGSWALTSGFVWDWTVPTDPGTAATVTYPVATKPANYVEITYPTAGNYIVNVAEHAPASFGGCVDATPTIMNVTVIDAPTATMSIAPAGWQEITANAAYQICSDQAAQTVTVAFAESAPNVLAGYSFAVAYKVETIDGSDVVTSTPTAWIIGDDFASSSMLKTGNAGTLPSAAFATTTPNFTYTFNTPALTIQSDGTNNSRTKYTYKLVRTGTLAAGVDAATNDFRSAISEKSDYLGSANYYSFTNSEIYFIVNPAPSTGPVYYIPNNFAL